MQSVIVNERPSICDLIDGFKDVEFAVEQIEDCFDDILDCTGDQLTGELCDAITVGAESGRRCSRRLLESIRRTITWLQLAS